MSMPHDPLWTGLGLVAPLRARVGDRVPGPVSGISIDTRTIAAGDLFFAIKGDNSDGHDYVDRAFAGGAAACVIDEAHAGRAKEWAGKGPLLIVDDVLEAMVGLGRAARARTARRVRHLHDPWRRGRPLQRSHRAAPLQCFRVRDDDKCRPPAAVGAACNKTDTPCIPGAACIGGVCSVYSGIGAVEYDVSGNRQPCGMGADFINYGTARCVLASPEGGPCDISNVHAASYQTCAMGLYCASAPAGGGATVPGTCRKPGGLGETCEHQVYGGIPSHQAPPAPAAVRDGHGVHRDVLDERHVHRHRPGRRSVRRRRPVRRSRAVQLRPAEPDQRRLRRRGHEWQRVHLLSFCDPGLGRDTSTSSNGICRPGPTSGSCLNGQCATGLRVQWRKHVRRPRDRGSFLYEHVVHDRFVLRCQRTRRGALPAAPRPRRPVRRPEPIAAAARAGHIASTPMAPRSAAARRSRSSARPLASPRRARPRAPAPGDVDCLPADDAGVTHKCAYACGP